MSLGWAWRRQLRGSAGAVLLAPGAVIAAIFALALTGGVGGISAIGDVFSGPSIPVSPALTSDAGRRHPGGLAKPLTPPPSRPPGRLDGAVNAATKGTGRLPNPAGALATPPLQTVGSTLNKVRAPKLAPAPRTIIGAVPLS